MFLRLVFLLVTDKFTKSPPLEVSSLITKSLRGAGDVRLKLALLQQFVLILLSEHGLLKLFIYLATDLTQVEFISGLLAHGIRASLGLRVVISRLNSPV